MYTFYIAIMFANKPFMTAMEFYNRMNERDEDISISDEEIMNLIDELVTAEFIETMINTEDQVIYKARHGLKAHEISGIDNPIKIQMLSFLIENPKTVFIIQNTQAGKTVIVAKEIIKWTEDRNFKPVGFFITLNDKTLTDQSAENLGAKCNNGKVRVKMFVLSSASKTSFDELKNYIDAYASDNYGEYPMPLICVLANTIQNKKVMQLLMHINRKCREQNSRLRHGIVFDEADDTYPKLRDLRVSVNGESVSYKKFIVEEEVSLHKLVFCSATDGDLLEDSDYPECQNAFVYPVKPDTDSQEYYRALHHPDAIKKNVPMPKRMSSNQYIKKVVEDNLPHFLEKIPGTEVFRKAICHSNMRTADMVRVGNELITMGFGAALVFDMFGVKLIQKDKAVQRFKTRGRGFNRLLFYIYKTNDLEKAPLAIIGRRKVDRGLGFHYAPRAPELIPDWGNGPLQTDGVEGLIWTDIVLGRIEDKSSASQKAGRLAGIIAHCPQYHSCTYWTDEYTWNSVLKHNQIVDEINDGSSYRTMIQAVVHSKETINMREAVARANQPPTPIVGPTITTTRSANNEGDFEMEPIREYTIEREARHYATGSHKFKTVVNTYGEFQICATTKKAEVQSYEEIKKILNGKKTALMDVKHCKIGDQRKRIFVGYTNIQDPTTAVYLVKTVKRIHESSA